MSASLKKLSDAQLVDKLIEAVAIATGFPENCGQLNKETKRVKAEVLRRLKGKKR